MLPLSCIANELPVVIPAALVEASISESSVLVHAKEIQAGAAE